MKKLINDWNELLTYEKVFRILTIVFAVATMVLAIMSLADMAIMEFCAGMVLLFQGIHLWRKQKGVAIFNLCTAAFILLVMIVHAFL